MEANTCNNNLRSWLISNEDIERGKVVISFPYHVHLYPLIDHRHGHSITEYDTDHLVKVSFIMLQEISHMNHTSRGVCAWGIQNAFRALREFY